MPVFRLEKYPFVCRLCLRPEQYRTMTSLDTEDESFGGGTYEDFLTTITFAVEKEKRHLFPRSVCAQCKELLTMFARFRTKVQNVHLFMNALVELRDFNPAPTRDLFQTKLGTVQTMLMELDVCHKADLQAEDLIDEFPQYEISKLSKTVRERRPEENATMEVDRAPESADDVEEVEEVQEPEEDMFFAEECPPEELAELTKEIVYEEVISEKIIGTADQQQEVAVETGLGWECFDDSDADEEMQKIPPPKRTPKSKTTPAPKVKGAKSTGKDINWDFLDDSEPEENTTLENIVDLEVALAKRKYGSGRQEEQMQCPKCPYTTHLKTNFHSHQLTHLKREQRIYACKEPGCDRKFTTRRNLAGHVESKHRTVDRTVICEICGQECGSSSKLLDHKKRHHNNGERNFACQYCQKTFKISGDLRFHVRSIHLSDNVYKCETCGMEFRRKNTLKAHETIHSDVYNYPCQQCDKKFKVRNLLNKHVIRVHKEASLECEHCSKMFFTKCLLIDHIESVHEIQMRFVCDVCLAMVDSQEKLAAHISRHDNPANLECGRCLMVFPEQEQMTDHMCITYRDDYICCGRDHRQYQMYNRHMFTKHSIKINARVKPEPGVLLGQIRAKRKRVESCSKCEAIFATRTLKKQHQEKCLAGDINS